MRPAGGSQWVRPYIIPFIFPFNTLGTLSDIVRYRRPPRGRLLGADDLARLGAVLRQREGENPVCVAAVRLLLLTGCRPGEIRCLRWCEVKPDRLTLIDAKTGPRHVPGGQE